MTTVMQRVRGAARVEIGPRGLIDLGQRGSAKAMMPRVDAAEPEVVFLNTAGGITGDDRLDYALDLRAGARATGATQTAERAYRAGGGTGRVGTRLSVGAGGRLDWLPQEMILYQGADIARVTEVDLAADAAFLGVDSVVLGRAAHGETVTAARLDDRRTIRRGGHLLHEEHVALDAAALAHPATMAGARAFATILFTAPGCADALGPLREALGDDGAASAWDGRLVARMVHPTAQTLRRALIRAIVALRRAPMPRVWQDDSP